MSGAGAIGAAEWDVQKLADDARRENDRIRAEEIEKTKKMAKWIKLKSKPKGAEYQGVSELGSHHYNPKNDQYYIFTHPVMYQDTGLKGSTWYKLRRMI